MCSRALGQLRVEKAPFGLADVSKLSLNHSSFRDKQQRLVLLLWIGLLRVCQFRYEQVAEITQTGTEVLECSARSIDKHFPLSVQFRLEGEYWVVLVVNSAGMHLNYSSCPTQNKPSKHLLFKNQFDKVGFLSLHKNMTTSCFAKVIGWWNCSSRQRQFKTNYSLLRTLFFKSLSPCIISEHLRDILLTSLGLFLCLKRNKCVMLYQSQVKSLLHFHCFLYSSFSIGSYGFCYRNFHNVQLKS